jgi:hypothetical protein
MSILEIEQEASIAAEPELPSLDPKIIANVQGCIERHGKDAGKCEQLLCGLDPLARMPYSQVSRGESIQDPARLKSQYMRIHTYICIAAVRV